MRHARRRRGFTLVELLVVIAILGVLIAMLLPAVESARESGRRAQCFNQLKQLALGAQNHLDAQKWFPTNGWGWNWVGDPDRGYGRKQPGGWIFNILPYIEQNDLRQLGAGYPPQSAQRTAATRQRCSTVVPILICPTRRKAILISTAQAAYSNVTTPNYSDPIQMIAHSDYAVCAGDTDFEDGDDKHPLSQGGPANLSDSTGTDWTARLKNEADKCTGIAYAGSQIRASQVNDGLSKTYFGGEKYVNPDHYYDCVDVGDAESMFCGNDDDITRTTDYPTTVYYYPPVPMQDTAGYPAPYGFGSAHPSVFNMAFCDGSVHAMSFEIDQLMHKRLGNRRDGGALKLSDFQ